MLDNLIANSDVLFQKHVFPMVQFGSATPTTDQAMALAETANMASNKTVDWTLKLVLQITNAAVFVGAMVVSGLSQYIMPYTLKEITAEWEAPIQPAGWAFSIWAVIYSLLGMFVVYQTIPTEWLDSAVFSWILPSRNDNLIFNKIHVVFAVN